MKKDNTNVNDRLTQSIRDYLLWMIDAGYAHSTWAFYDRIFKHFAEFISCRHIAWESIFTSTILAAFGKEYRLLKFETPIRGLSRYLFEQKKIEAPLGKKVSNLPEIYEKYLVYYQKSSQVTSRTIQQTRRVLRIFADWLSLKKIELLELKIEQLDRFMAELNAPFAPNTKMHNRSFMRGFLHYIHHEHNIGNRDLAPFVIGATQFGYCKPPRFLRPEELQKIFKLRPETPKEKRALAMLHLAYFLGMRPKEISRIRLDDIEFRRQEIILPQRKGFNPISMPLPDKALQAIGAYIVEVRPQTDKRSLFISTRPPYMTITAGVVSADIKAWMHKAGLSASAYWLRHTYAQNLLEANASVFEIKEMLGHDQIQTTRRYLHIHTKMMREVLFDEKI